MGASGGPKHGKGAGRSGSNAGRKHLSQNTVPILAAIIGAIGAVIAAAVTGLIPVFFTTNGSGALSGPSPSMVEGGSGISVSPSALSSSSSTAHPTSRGGTESQGDVSAPPPSSIRAASTESVRDLPNAPDSLGEKYTLKDLNCVTVQGSSPRLGTWSLSSQEYNNSVAYPGFAGGSQFFYYCSFGRLWTGTMDVTQGINYAAGPNPPLFVGATILAYEGNKLFRWDMGVSGGALKHYEITMKNVIGFYLDTDTCANGCLPQGDHFVWADISMYPSQLSWPGKPPPSSRDTRPVAVEVTCAVLASMAVRACLHLLRGLGTRVRYC